MDGKNNAGAGRAPAGNIPGREEILASAMTEPEKAGALAEYYSRRGLNCAECVMLACMDVFGSTLPPEVISLATGFGGGMGRTRNTCGAVSGAVMALGTQKGRTHPLEKENPGERPARRSDMYEPFGKMVTEIEDNFGSLICRELINPNRELPGRERKRSCRQIIVYCARKAAEYLSNS